jgi:hypothetical protein
MGGLHQPLSRRTVCHHHGKDPQPDPRLIFRQNKKGAN